jgi:hypothetical protein
VLHQHFNVNNTASLLGAYAHWICHFYFLSVQI